VLKDAEDDSFSDNEVDDAPTPMTIGERQEHHEECEDIEFE